MVVVVVAVHVHVVHVHVVHVHVVHAHVHGFHVHDSFRRVDDRHQAFEEVMLETGRHAAHGGRHLTPDHELVVQVTAVLQQELHRLPGPDLYDVRTEAVFGHVDPDVCVRASTTAGGLAPAATGCSQDGYCQDHRRS